jgi:hypothetical protein
MTVFDMEKSKQKYSLTRRFHRYTYTWIYTGETFFVVHRVTRVLRDSSADTDKPDLLPSHCTAEQPDCLFFQTEVAAR